jgi:hypothetical protein
MQFKLSGLEVEILRKLVNGEAIAISSQQRLRLELAGMIREGAKGMVLTLTGRGFLAREKQPQATGSDAAPKPKISRDSRGRRMPFQRRSVF